MKEKKKVLIAVLLVLLSILAVAYAKLAQQLSINGTAAIESMWDIRITNISEKSKSTGAATKAKSYDATTANFDVGFTSPGDYIIYTIQVSNLGTLDAILKNINLNPTTGTDAIEYTISGLKEGNTITASSNVNFDIKIKFKEDVSEIPKKNSSYISLTLNYAELLGDEIITTDADDIIYTAEYDYETGEKIRFNNEDWYVIKKSPRTDDYVTILKGSVLTGDELTENYRMTINNTTTDKMAYYWSNNCYYGSNSEPVSYGRDGPYASGIVSDCKNYYDQSKAKQFLEQVYLNRLNQVNLKLINNYKVRLITMEEFDTLKRESKTKDYQEYGTTSCFWTMTRDEEPGYGAWHFAINRYNNTDWLNVYRGCSIRPVINLLKSAIE